MENRLKKYIDTDFYKSWGQDYKDILNKLTKIEEVNNNKLTDKQLILYFNFLINTQKICKNKIYVINSIDVNVSPLQLTNSDDVEKSDQKYITEKSVLNEFYIYIKLLTKAVINENKRKIDIYRTYDLNGKNGYKINMIEKLNLKTLKVKNILNRFY